ncbi:MAG: BBP7 family outer membrane beta-barrel protein [Gemmataceae bacterium]
MRRTRTIFATLGSLLTSAGLSLAQSSSVPAELPPTVPPSATAAAPAMTPLSVVDTGCPIPATDCHHISKLWGSAEYLLWWTKDAGVPAPLVTTGPVTPNLAPVIGQPGTAILVGGNGVDIGTRSGGRFTIGGWLNQADTIGAELSYLFLGNRSVHQTVGSPATPGSPFLALPFVNAQTGGESSTRLALPGGFSGIANLNISSSLQAAETNLLVNAFRGNGWTVNLLGGFRFLNLREQLTFTTDSVTAIGPPDVFRTLDKFHTNNDFYGGQIGFRAERQFGAFFVNTAAKIALGDMHQSVCVNGGLATNDFNGLGAPQVFPGGYFTQPTNIGRFTTDRFATVTDVTVNVGYQLTHGARVFAGYTLLYVTNVVRPGDQIDRNINPSQAPAIIGAAALPPGGLVGPAAPLPQLNRTDFWAQGLNVGLEFRY